MPQNLDACSHMTRMIWAALTIYWYAVDMLTFPSGTSVRPVLLMGKRDVDSRIGNNVNPVGFKFTHSDPSGGEERQWLLVATRILSNGP